MIKRSVASLIGGFFILFSASLAIQAQDEKPAPSDQDLREARQFVLQVTDTALDILRDQTLEEDEREGQLSEAMNEYFALDYIGQFVLGRHRSKLSGQQMSDYQSVFKDYIVATYLVRLEEYSNEEVRVGQARPAGSRDVFVDSKIFPSNADPLAMEWRVRPMQDSWQVIDVKLEGISQAITQRQEFSAVIQKDGVDRLITLLRERTYGAQAVLDADQPSGNTTRTTN